MPDDDRHHVPTEESVSSEEKATALHTVRCLGHIPTIAYCLLSSTTLLTLLIKIVWVSEQYFIL
jgi:hypothetical protein